MDITEALEIKETTGAEVEVTLDGAEELTRVANRWIMRKRAKRKI